MSNADATVYGKVTGGVSYRNTSSDSLLQGRDVAVAGCGQPGFTAARKTCSGSVIFFLITLVILAGFSVLYLKEPMTWNYAVGFALIAAGAFFVFRGPL
jgi:hypothetical protein